jgi:hypothetical protein
VANSWQAKNPLSSPTVKSEDIEDVNMGGMGDPLVDLAEEEEAEDADTRQALLLGFESGDCMVLLLHETQEGALEFIMACQESYAPRDLLMYPGFHLAVDPSSRYAALGCPDGLFFIYELEELGNIRIQAAAGMAPVPVRSYRPRSVDGVIHTLEFLHPPQGERDQVILLLILVRSKLPKIVIYDWKVGDDLAKTLSGKAIEHKIWDSRELPLFIVPLTVQSSFLMVTENKVGICKNFVQGIPELGDFKVRQAPAKDKHCGLKPPLWTAWTRPIRLPRYSRGKDCVYLAREDGYVVFLEIGSSSLEGSIALQHFNCNIYSGFCSIFEKSSDILVMAGDRGSGEIWKVIRAALLLVLLALSCPQV